jgi:hypothetical protein
MDEISTVPERGSTASGYGKRLQREFTVATSHDFFGAFSVFAPICSSPVLTYALWIQ